jgi:hypothetical protein
MLLRDKEPVLRYKASAWLPYDAFNYSSDGEMFSFSGIKSATYAQKFWMGIKLEVT